MTTDMHDVFTVISEGPSQLGCMQSGTITAQPTASGYPVHFLDGVSAMSDLTCSEAELEKVSL